MPQKTFTTTADFLFEILSKHKSVTVAELAAALDTTERSIMKIAHYFEEEGFVKIEYRFKGPVLSFLESDDQIFSLSNKEEIIIILKEFKRGNRFDDAKKLIEKLYEFCKARNNPLLNSMYKEIYTLFVKSFSQTIETTKDDVSQISMDRVKELTHYQVWHDNVVVDINIVKNELEPVPFYNVGLVSLQHTTEIILDKIKDSIISELDYDRVFKSSADHHELIKEQFKSKIKKELHTLFPNLKDDDIDVFVNYVIITSIGLGDVEFLLKDAKLEEIVINNAFEPIWVYHREYGWLKTNIILGDENRIRHFATIGGRVVDKNITNLEPLLDGHLETGDRFNATLAPISTKGNTITIRKFAAKPLTIVDMLKKGSIDYVSASMVWLCIQFEMSILIVGGTGSGKTTALNVFSVFIQPNQRIISIEDTRELTLANTLHWVAMRTRDPNPEGRGGVSMLDLIVNALRMRPDRILFGEIRKREEAETLFEAMHTGHSVIATFHANNAEDAQTRLTEPPINLPSMMLSSLGFIVVLNRNRRTGKRVVLQLAEVGKKGDFRVIKEFDYSKSDIVEVAPMDLFYKYLKLYGGLTPQEVERDLKDKQAILKRLVDLNIDNMHDLGMLFSKYYIGKEYFLSEIDKLEKKRVVAAAEAKKTGPVYQGMSKTPAVVAAVTKPQQAQLQKSETPAKELTKAVLQAAAKPATQDVKVQHSQKPGLLTGDELKKEIAELKKRVQEDSLDDIRPVFTPAAAKDDKVLKQRPILQPTKNFSGFRKGETDNVTSAKSAKAIPVAQKTAPERSAATIATRRGKKKKKLKEPSKPIRTEEEESTDWGKIDKLLGDLDNINKKAK